MANLTAGYSFGATETVTNTKLGTLVTSGSVSNIAQTDIVAGEGLVHVGTSAPSDTDQLWIDTSSTPNLTRYYHSALSAWVPSAEYALLTNKTGQTGSAGRVCIFDTSNSNSYKYTSTAGDPLFIGIETGSIANNSAAPVISNGLATVNLELSASAGVFLRTSTATGKAEPCLGTSTGVFGFLTEAGTASGRSRIFGQAFSFSASATSASAASQAEMEAGTNASNPVTPGFAHFHPAASKAWAIWDGTITGTHGTLAGFNASSITRTAAGRYLFKFSTAMSSVNYVFHGAGIDSSGTVGQPLIYSTSAQSASGFQVQVTNAGGADTDIQRVMVSVFGDI